MGRTNITALHAKELDELRIAARDGIATCPNCQTRWSTVAGARFRVTEDGIRCANVKCGGWRPSREISALDGGSRWSG